MAGRMDGPVSPARERRNTSDGKELIGDFMDDEEEHICRICRCEEEEDRPLFHPCICTGSIKYVHEDCLLQWLEHSSNSSGRSKCELCGHTFGFTPKYAEDAPASLSVFEVLNLCVVHVLKTVPFMIRFVVVVLTWGILIPIATCVMFRILSLGKLDRSGQLFQDFESAQTGWASFVLRLRIALEGGLYSSWGIGVCASGGIFLSFLTLISVVDYVREHHVINELINENEQDDLGVDEMGAPDRLDGDDDVLGNINWGQVEDENPRFGDMANAAHGAQPMNVADDDGDNHDDMDGVDDGDDDLWAADIDDNDDNNVGDLNVAMDELLGLRGPGWVLIHNVLWLLTFNGLYLCVALFAPTTVGAVTTHLLARLFEYASEATWGRPVKLLSEEDEAFLLRTTHLLRSEQQVQRAEMAKFVQLKYGPWHEHAYAGQGGAGLRALKSSIERGGAQEPDAVCSLEEEDSEGRRLFFEEFHWIWLEVQAVFLGYLVVACALALLCYCAKRMRDNATTAVGRRGYRSVARVLSLMSRTFKVVIIVFLKMGAFPVMLGLLLEQAGVEFVDLPIDRFEFAAEHPVFAAMTLWVAGITHMLVITVIVLELRDVLHPDILHGIIRPKEADESLLRTVLEDPIPKHVRRMALSCAIYSVLVFAFIYLPTMLIKATSWGSALPYRVTLNYAVMEVQLPFELMCIHIGVLTLLDQGKNHIRNGIEVWFRTVSHYLGLTEFLLPLPKDENDDEQEAQQDDQDQGWDQYDSDQLSEDEEEEEDDDDEVLAEEEEDSDAEQENEQALPPAAAPHDGSEGDASASANLKPRKTPSFWLVRVVVICFLAWASAMVMTITVGLVPFHVGRAMVQLLQLPVVHEPLIFGIGTAMIWRSLTAAITLKLYRAPAVLFEKLSKAITEGRGATASFRNELQWTLFIFFALLSPWLLGVVIQAAILLPSNHPSINVLPNESSLVQWAFPYQFHALLEALSGNAMQVSPEQVCAIPTLNKFVGDGLDKMDKAANLAESLKIYSSPANDWLIGLVVEIVLINVIMHQDIMRVRPVGLDFHLRFMACIDEMTKRYNCVPMKRDFLLPFIKIQLAMLSLPLFTPAAVDLLMYFVSGRSPFASMGVINLYRHSAPIFLFVFAVPTLQAEVLKVWTATHTALRDERYLIGKKLHNMERTSRQQI